MASVFKKEHIKFESLTIIFCSDDYLLEINKVFLSHDFYTDIITFNMAETTGPVSGEIYISVDRVRENALILHEGFTKELHRVIFHGVLHLCGYKDKSKKDQVIMRSKEEKYLKLYFSR